MTTESNIVGNPPSNYSLADTAHDKGLESLLMIIPHPPIADNLTLSGFDWGIEWQVIPVDDERGTDEVNQSINGAGSDNALPETTKRKRKSKSRGKSPKKQRPTVKNGESSESPISKPKKENPFVLMKQWPMRPALENLLKKIAEVERKCKSTDTATMESTGETGEMKQILAEAREELTRLDEQRQKDSTEIRNFEKLFFSEGVSKAALKEKLYSAFPWLLPEEIATNEPDQGKGNFQTCLRDLENEIFAEDNTYVELSDFPGLEEAIEKRISVHRQPEYLEPIASRIRKARGEDTEYKHMSIETLVCAAIHDMENLAVEELNWNRLKKWGATFNMARECNFPVEFAEFELKKNLYVYFAYSRIQQYKGIRS